MEALSLEEEPVQPAPFKAYIAELLESTFLVYFGVVGKLSSFDKAKYDSFLQSDKDRSNPFERERIVGSCVVGLHRQSQRWELDSGIAIIVTDGLLYMLLEPRDRLVILERGKIGS